MTLASSTVAPNPYPAALYGIWTNCVNPRNAKYSPMPTNIVARLVSMIGRRVIIWVDTSVCFTPRSQNHHFPSPASTPTQPPRDSGVTPPHPRPSLTHRTTPLHPPPTP